MSRGVLVTGASRGIGAAVARAFAEQGDRVAVHYGGSRERRRGRCVAGLPGDGHLLVQADLADPDAVRRTVDEAADRLGGLDVLVNNAGVFLAHPPLTTSSSEWQAAWTQTLAANLTGAAHATFCAVPHLVARGGGAVVNVSSRGAFRGEPDCPAYGASKAGLNAFGQSMAQALAPQGISVAPSRPGSWRPTWPARCSTVRAATRSGAVAARPGRAPRGGRRRGAVARLAGRSLRDRHDRRRQRGVVPAQLRLRRRWCDMSPYRSPATASRGTACSSAARSSSVSSTSAAPTFSSR